MFIKSLLVLLLATMASSLRAEDALTADQILEKLVEANGGDAFTKMKSLHCTGTIEYVGQGLKGNIELFAKSPGMSWTRMEIPDVLTAIEGCDGTDSWDANPLVGAPRLKVGTERAFQILHSKTDLISNAKAYFNERKVTGSSVVQDKACYVLTMTPKESVSPFVYHIEKETFLLRREAAILEGPQGRVSIVSDILKYKDFKGAKIPEEMIISIVQMSMKLTFDSIKIDTHVPDTLFTFPNKLNMTITQVDNTTFTIGDDATPLKRSDLIRHLQRLNRTMEDFTIPSITLSGNDSTTPAMLKSTARWMESLTETVTVEPPTPSTVPQETP